MKIEALRVGMKVRHPQYGTGVVISISEKLTEIRFEDGTQRTVDPDLGGLTSAESTVTLTGLDIPLAGFIQQTVEETLSRLGYDKPDAVVNELAIRYQRGKLVIHSADASLQTKEIPLETFFHKVVMMRNQLRVLEQKINGHAQLNDAEKVEFQQYITRCYGSMTSFNLLFKDKESQF
jgi:hypothetical protein